MAQVMTDDKHYKAIADELRKVNGDSEDIKYLPADMKGMVKWSCECARNGGYYDGHEAGLETGRKQGKAQGYTEGLEAGKTEGYTEGLEAGKTEGYAEGLEAGKVAEHDRFWDAFQTNGNRTDYTYAFAYAGWTDTNFKPKYDIVPTAGENMFRRTEITNLASILEKQGVVLDLSNCPSFANMFNTAKVTRLPKIDASNATSIASAFSWCSSLVSVEEFVFSSKLTTAATSFNQCTKLVEFKASGTIPVTIDFSACPLNAESIVSIVEALSPSASSKSVTFKESAINNADWSTTDYASWDELKATKPNWGFAYA